MREFDNSFLGRGWAFPPRFDRRAGTAEMVADEQDIRESLQILFATARQERTMLPLYGCSLHPLLFENMGAALYFRIQDAVREAILAFEPRILVDDIQAVQDAAEPGKVNVLIRYTIPQTNTRSSMVYPFYLLEGSNTRRIGPD